jgi:hypothetical protein
MSNVQQFLHQNKLILNCPETGILFKEIFYQLNTEKLSILLFQFSLKIIYCLSTYPIGHIQEQHTIYC